MSCGPLEQRRAEEVSFDGWPPLTSCSLAVFCTPAGGRCFTPGICFGVVSFGLARDIPWTQVRSLHLIQDKRRTRMILETAEKRITLRSDTLTDGWGDFVDFALTLARERNIPYKFQQVQSAKRRGAPSGSRTASMPQHRTCFPAGPPVWTSGAKVMLFEADPAAALRQCTLPDSETGRRDQYDRGTDHFGADAKRAPQRCQSSPQRLDSARSL